VKPGTLDGHRDGFTLVEVLVSLILLELGLVAVAATITTAARAMNRAHALEWAVTAAGEVADSLAFFGSVTAGQRSGPGGLVEWEPVDEGSTVRVRIRALPNTPQAVRPLEVDAVITSAGASW
jgi:type II secretory pathway pseudopilin PulG